MIYEPTKVLGRVLVIAGSDSGGGAGIQADIKTITALGCFATTAITALTAQNTKGVFDILEVPPDFISSQINLVLDDIGTDVVKTGMLNKSKTIEMIAQILEQRINNFPLIVDPVMTAKNGSKLLDDLAIMTLLVHLIPKSAIVTPNIPEAIALTGITIKNVDDMIIAGKALLTKGARAVLIKGGHLPSNKITDVLIDVNGVEIFEDSRIETTSTHGTGCTMASAIAAGLAQDLPLKVAVLRARQYVQLALSSAPGFGQGCGPINHAHTIDILKISYMR
ncbi:MAG: bifunctional hydroxymethylpyrimidine kinase/phosphomethylpyrimidine kinase [Rhodospirillaceae bacterium]|jgi:hydroxymethylpyrimidine/phosphomethylpyrimidine kinase|nr:bifunctional hydroxymethylpyrimidine kinase/phosphomethylpyrimidine kinase [Rhodospirillaceae bacterium]